MTRSVLSVKTPRTGQEIKERSNVSEIGVWKSVVKLEKPKEAVMMSETRSGDIDKFKLNFLDRSLSLGNLEITQLSD